MALTHTEARRALLSMLLERYERSRSYGRTDAWRRDIIVKLDAETFPDAFAADGREDLSELRAAAAALAHDGAARVIRASAWGDAVVREVRLGPEQVDKAYRLAGEQSFEPLATGLGAVADRARTLRIATEVRWFRDLLDRVAADLDRADTACLGMQRQRFKREWRDVADALTAAARLAGGVTGWERIVSESIFGNSKRLGEVRARVIELLIRTDPRWEGVDVDDPRDLLEAYGIRRKPGLIRCAGGGQLEVGGRVYRLEDFTPVAHLPEAWAAAWVEGVAASGVRCLTTIENEYPFLSYVEERGGPAALGAAGEVAVYVAGFPTPGLTLTLRALCDRCPEIDVRHWGDADVGGLRIWWLLRERLGRPIRLFRTNRSWLEREASRCGTRLRSGEIKALQRLRREFDAAPRAVDMVEAMDLVDALVELRMKVEQERG